MENETHRGSASWWKTGISTRHASLDYPMDRYSEQLGHCYVLHTKDLKKGGNILYLPIYMTLCLR